MAGRHTPVMEQHARAKRAYPDAIVFFRLGDFYEMFGDDAVVGRTPVSLTLSGDRAYGNAGCNHWFASYRLEGENLRFENIGSTRKMCAEPIMRQEQRFLELLGQVQRWDVSRIDQLRLWPAQGEPLRFWPEQD